MKGKQKQDRFLWAMGAWRRGGNLAGRYAMLGKSEKLWVRYLVEEGYTVSTAVQTLLFFGIPERRVK